MAAETHAAETVLSFPEGDPAAEPSPTMGEKSDVKVDVGEAAAEELDMYRPLPMDPNIPVEHHILTARAIVTGVILGCVVNASNLYLGELGPVARAASCKPGVGQLLTRTETSQSRPEDGFLLLGQHVRRYLRLRNPEAPHVCG